MRLANSSLRGVKFEKLIQEGKARRSYTEVMALTINSLEEYFGPFLGTVARVPSWLKEASTGLDKHVLGTEIPGLTQREQTKYPARPIRGQEDAGTF